MKKLKTVAALLIVLAMMFAVAACDSGDSGTTPTPAPPVDPGPGTPAATPDPGSDPEPEGPVYDMEGRTIRFGAHWKFYDFLTGDDPPDPATSEDYEIDMMKYENLLRVQDRYNVKFEWIASDWGMMLENLVSSTMAGDPWAEIMTVEGNWLMPGLMQDLFLSSDEFVRPQNDIANEQMVMKWDGALFGRDVIFRLVEPNFYGAFLGYNRDMVNALGLDDPGEIYDRGGWTWDVFMDMAMRAVNADKRGFSGIPNQNWKNWMASNGVKMVDEATGRVMADTPAMLNVLQFMQDMFFTNKVAYVYNDDIWSWDGGGVYNDGDSLFWTWYHWEIPYTADSPLPFNFGIISYPKGPDNPHGYTYSKGPWGWGLIRGIEEPEWVYTIYEELHHWFGDDRGLMDDDVFDYLATKITNQADLNRLLHLSTNTGLSDLSENVPDADHWRLAVPVATGEMTPAQVVESRKQELQDAVDQIFG